MAPRALSLLAIPFVAKEAVALRHATTASIDPTPIGQTMTYAEHQPWIAQLFEDHELAAKELNSRYPAVLAAIQNSLATPGNLTNYQEACRAIYGVAILEHKTKPYIAAAGGIEVSLKGMKAYMDIPDDPLWPEKHAHEAKQCAAAVSMLSLYQKDVQEEAGKAGAVELVLDLQRKYNYDGAMQLGGFSECFMDFSEANRIRWAAAGGITYTLEEIKKYYNEPEAVLQGWYAFSSGTSTPNGKAFVEQGGISVAMRSFVEHGNYSHMREAVMQAMRGMAGCDGCEDGQTELTEAGFLEKIADAMALAPDDYHVQSPACANVEILTKTSEKAQLRAVEAGLAELAVKAIQNFPGMTGSKKWMFDDQYTVYDDCMGALANLVGNEQVRSSLRSSDFQSVIQMILHVRPNSARLSASAAVVLEALDESATP